MIKKKSEFSVGDTLDRLEGILKNKGIKPLARVDHSAAAQSVDMPLRPTQVLLFGNPALGTPLMQSNQIAGLDLPMRVLAWEDETGATWLGYNAPQDMIASLSLQNVDDVAEKMANVLDALTDGAIKK